MHWIKACRSPCLVSWTVQWVALYKPKTAAVNLKAEFIQNMGKQFWCKRNTFVRKRNTWAYYYSNMWNNWASIPKTLNGSVCKYLPLWNSLIKIILYKKHLTYSESGMRTKNRTVYFGDIKCLYDEWKHYRHFWHEQEQSLSLMMRVR